MGLVRIIERIGAYVIDTVMTVGDFVLFLASALFYSLTPPYKPRLLIRQLRIIGAESFFLLDGFCKF
jgi:ABC-type transporter Mla maintaining outer membrane lipid asymmetry permease subunit MlaE